MSASNNSSNSTSDDESESVYRTVILAILGSLGVLFNGVLLIVLWRNKTPEFRVGTSYVIGNLALADCLTGISVLLLVSGRDSILDFQIPMVWTTIEASLMSLMFLSLERMLVFYYPFASKTVVTVKRTIIVISLIWCFAITCGFLVHFFTLISQLAMTILYELCVTIFILSQSYVIFKMQQRKRRNLFCDRDLSLVTRKHLYRQRLNNHVTTVVLILIVIVVITLLPYMVALQIYILADLGYQPLSPNTKKNVFKFIKYFYPIELLNFIVNPIIYAYRLKRYREAFYYAFSFLQCGPFVKERKMRTYSGASVDEEENGSKKFNPRQTIRMITKSSKVVEKKNEI